MQLSAYSNVYYLADIASKAAHIVILTLCIEIIYAAWIKEVKFCLESADIWYDSWEGNMRVHSSSN